MYEYAKGNFEVISVVFGRRLTYIIITIFKEEESL